MIINQKIFPLFFILLFCEVVALFSIKEYQVSRNKSYAVLGILAYICVALSLISIVHQNNNISLTNVAWNVMSSIYGIFIGYIIFKEKITKTNLIGVLIGMFSLILINGEN
jgi:multidrug transporter EmrE-like cation transporter